MTSAEDAQSRRILRKQISEAALRLINLLALADIDDDKAGPLAKSIRSKVEVVKEVFFDIILLIASGRLDIVKSELEKHLSRKEIVLGFSAGISSKLAEVESVILVLGGVKTLNAEMRRTLAWAWDEVIRIQEEEQNSFLLANLSADIDPLRPVTRPIRPLEGDDAIDSQAGVMKSLNDKLQ